MSNKEVQKRELKVSDVQIREMEDGRKTIVGVIPYNQRSEWMGFYEYITPSAFSKTLSDGADVRALMGHDNNKLIGRVKNGSLRLVSDDYGLHIECDLPDTEYARDAYALIKGGYNNGLSFGFYTIQDRWEQKEEEGQMCDVCYLLEVRLLEVSFCVSFPAYEGTNSEARSVRSIMDDIKKLKPEEIQAIDKEMRELLPEEKEPASDPSTSAGEPTDAEQEQARQLESFLAELKSM